MKLEKRSSGAEQAPATDSQETTPKGKKPVVVYIMILFIVAFLLMALSFMMHQRSNSEVLGELPGLRLRHAGDSGHAGPDPGPAKAA